MLETLPASAFVNIEAKRFRFRSDGLEAGIVDAVRRHSLAGRCIVSSFNPVLLWRLARIDRTIALHPYHEQVTAKLMQQTHGRGQQVNTWTVNEPDEMRRLVGLGVDSLITDRPDVLSALLAGAD